MSSPTRAITHRAFMATILVNAIVGFGDMVLAVFFIFGEFFLNILAKLSTLQNVFGTILSKIHTFLTSIPAESYLLIIIYFLSHGIIKLFLARSLYRKKLWAYPLAIVCFIIFSVYQLFPTLSHPSVLNIFLLILNLSVLFFVWREYLYVRALLRKI